MDLHSPRDARHGHAAVRVLERIAGARVVRENTRVGIDVESRTQTSRRRQLRAIATGCVRIGASDVQHDAPGRRARAADVVRQGGETVLAPADADLFESARTADYLVAIHRLRNDRVPVVARAPLDRNITDVARV